MSITCPLISTSPYQTTSCVLSASWSLSLDSCIGSCQQPRCLMDGDPSVLHVQTVPQVDAACRDETSATTKLAAGGWADRRQCVLISQRALRLIYFSDMRRRDRKQQQLCLFLSERLLWGFEVISWTARTVKKQACVKSSGQSRHEHHYKFIKSQVSEVRCIFRVIAAHPPHATRLGLPKNCLATLRVKMQSKIISWHLVECNCVCRTKCIRDVRGGVFYGSSGSSAVWCLFNCLEWCHWTL